MVIDGSVNEVESVLNMAMKYSAAEGNAARTILKKSKLIWTMHNDQEWNEQNRTSESMKDFNTETTGRDDGFCSKWLIATPFVLCRQWSLLFYSVLDHLVLCESYPHFICMDLAFVFQWWFSFCSANRYITLWVYMVAELVGSLLASERSRRHAWNSVDLSLFWPIHSQLQSASRICGFL